jgi:hypothetical protein
METYNLKVKIAKLQLELAKKEQKMAQLICNLPDFKTKVNDLAGAVCYPEILRYDYNNEQVDRIVVIFNEVENLKLKIFNLNK